MATRAEQAKAAMQRSHAKKAAQPRKVKPNAVDTARRGVSATTKRARGTPTGTENESMHGFHNAHVVMEESASGKRSRKSTRAGANRGKNSGKLEYAAMQKLNRPQVRHARKS